MYKLLKTPDGKEVNTIYRKTDGAFIPKNLDNRDYQEYLKWVEEGNTPEPADQPE